VGEAVRPTVGVTILLVDDDEAVRQGTRRLLEADGHRVLEAADGAEAVKAIRGESIDLVLTDLYMPNMDGIELVRQLRQIRGPNLKIIAISGAEGTGYPDMRPIAAALGVTATLGKPFTREELRHAIMQAVGLLPQTPRRQQ